MADYYDTLFDDPFGSSSRRRKKQQTVRLSPEERASLAATVGSGVVSGVSAVGNVLDLPGSMVRDLLGGQNPLDQLLSPFTAKNRYTGRDLMRHHNLIGSSDNWGNFAGGLAAEIALDPLTYLTLGTGGALTKGGQVAAKSGLLAKVPQLATRRATRESGEHLARGAAQQIGKRQARTTMTLRQALEEAPEFARDARNAAKQMGVKLSDVADEPLSHLMGVGAPFSKPAALIGGQGRVGQGVARGLDAAGDWMAHGAYSPVKPFVPLFNKSMKGMTTREGQMLAQARSESDELAQAGVRSDVFNDVKALNEFRYGPDKQTLNDADWMDMRRSLEGIGQDLKRGVGSKAIKTTGEILPDHLKPLAPMLDRIRGDMQTMLAKERAAGLPTRDVGDFFADYFPRARAKDDGVIRGAYEAFRGQSKMFDATHAFQNARRAELRDVPGASAGLAKMIADPNISGVARRTKSQPGRSAAQGFGRNQKLDYVGLERYFRNKYGGQGGVMHDHEVTNLVRYLANLDPKYADRGAAFWENPMDSLLRRKMASERAISSAEMVYRLMGDSAMGADELALRADPHGYEDIRNIASAMGLDGDTMYQKVMDIGQKNRLEAARASGRHNIPSLGRQGAAIYVPKDIAADATRLIKTFTAPDDVSRFAEILDGVTNVFRASVTAPFPAFHTRNFISGTFNNWIMGAFHPRSISQAQELMKGKTVQGLPEVFGRTAADRTRQLQEELFAFQVHSPGHGRHAAGLEGGAAVQVADEIAGMKPTTLGKAANPKEFVTSMGRSMGDYVEGLNRISPYIELRKQGYSAREAAKKVFAAQVDYRNLSQFERGFMRRAIPFYSFSRGIAPFVLGELAQRPGGKLAQTVRATNRTRRDDKPLPEYIGQTMAADVTNIFGAKEGYTKYITGLGLAHEDTLNMFRPGATPYHTVLGTGQEILGRSHPIPKSALELASGTQFFSGRNMEDLDPALARTFSNVMGMDERPNSSILLEQAVSNSPAARFVSTARQIADPRKKAVEKALNLTTGLRVTDVDQSKASEIALRERLEDLLKSRRGVQSFETLYAPDPDKLTPNDALYMTLYRDILNESQTRRRRAQPKNTPRRKKDWLDGVLD